MVICPKTAFVNIIGKASLLNAFEYIDGKGENAGSHGFLIQPGCF